MRLDSDLAASRQNDSWNNPNSYDYGNDALGGLGPMVLQMRRNADLATQATQELSEALNARIVPEDKPIRLALAEHLANLSSTDEDVRRESAEAIIESVAAWRQMK